MYRNKIVYTGVLILAVLLLSSCSTNNSSQMKNLSYLGQLGTSENTNAQLPHDELQVIFNLTKDAVKIDSITTKRMNRSTLVSLLNQNEGKDIQKGDSFTDCIIITNNSNSKPCFSNSNRNIPKNSVFHESEVSGGMVLMTVLVPYVVVGAASDNDFYIHNKINTNLINRVGATIKKDISDTIKKIHNDLTNSNAEFNKDIIPYINLIEHDTLINAINETKSIDKLNVIERILTSGNYSGFVVKSPVVNQRQKPSTRSKVINKYKKGTLIVSEKIEKGWVYDGKGWIFEKILKPRMDDAQKSITYRKNNLKLNQQYTSLVEGDSLTSIDKVLKNKKQLVGVSQKKINKLKSKRYKLIDKKDFDEAAVLNSISAYDEYLVKHKNGTFRNQANSAKRLIYINQASFDGYMNAFVLTGERTLLELARSTILESNTPTTVTRSLLNEYFDAKIKHKNAIPQFTTLIENINGVSVIDYSSKLLNLSGISKSFTTSNFFKSTEYQYILQYLKPQIDIAYKHKFIDIKLSYPDVNITLTKNASCDFKETKSGVRDRGFFESLVTLNGDDKLSYTYDVYSCMLGNTELSSVQSFIKKLPTYLSKTSLSNLSGSWETTKKTSSYTYSSSAKSSPSSSHKANWEYTIKCKDHKLLSSVPTRTYTGIISNSTYTEARQLAEREQSKQSCYERFGSKYSGEGYLDLELQ